MNRMNLRYAIIFILMVIMLSGCGKKTAGYYYKEGLKNVKNGNNEEAANSFSKAIEMNPERAEYYIDYGMTLIMLEKYEEAILYFDKVIFEKDNMIVNKNNKQALRGKGITYYKAHKYSEAVEQFDLALSINELSDLNLDILYYKGSSQERLGHYEEALETYTAILTENPKDAVIYNSRAFVYSKLGDYNNSLADYDKAILLDKENYDYYFGKYSLMFNSDHEVEAAAVLEEASNIPIKTEEDKFNLAKIHYYMGDYERAIIELSEAFSNGFFAAYFYLGDIYEKEQDYDAAVYNYEMFIEDESTSKSAAVYNQVGACLIKLGEYEKALSYIRTGLEQNDIELEQPLKRNEIVALEEKGEFEEAYRLMTSYLELYPEDEEAVEEYEFLKTRLPEVSTKEE